MALLGGKGFAMRTQRAKPSTAQPAGHPPRPCPPFQFPRGRKLAGRATQLEPSIKTGFDQKVRKIARCLIHSSGWVRDSQQPRGGSLTSGLKEEVMCCSEDIPQAHIHCVRCGEELCTHQTWLKCPPHSLDAAPACWRSIFVCGVAPKDVCTGP